ncbi:iron-enterobactin ABC transporter permease [Rhodococcus erythropolis]|uniref:iron-enterobactin ABC transporter permease n=1 Tax=Rhodococcus erythropolis TaxID=1833 RepID=UPI00294A7718|nr:iron-enterobactin ABC transporter permease [Rhodococcus erythropolis]MDV6275257.1 iron-enterobactin ABC transporter permease [Rhodococcus erythropolis]
MSIDFGRPTTVVRSPKEGWSARIDVRTVTVCLILVALALAIGVIALGSGDYQVPIGDVLGALFGEAPARIHMVVVEWRLPRVLLALMLGAALGMSGAIFQSLTRNPLGSPDIIGFNSGAYTGALVVILLIGGTYYEIAVGALVGGIATAAVVYLLAYKRGVQGFRLIIVGIAISAMLGSVNTWMILKAKLDDAMAAAVWGAGSLNGLGWTQVWPVVVVLAILIPLILVLGRRMQMLEMGDDAAKALGVRAEPTRLSLVVLGVALTAMVTAAAGPIGFVSLAAPQLVKRLTGSAGVTLLPSAAMGGALLMVSDWVAQRAFAPTQLPVGVVTVSIGGIYFVWLLAREARKQ